MIFFQELLQIDWMTTPEENLRIIQADLFTGLMHF